ncbi:MAG TPA: TPM domain-containing protein [Allosphingosinicella sp.]|nr:TPM domain-containing protein [Allosphingosinicella sp.]
MNPLRALILLFLLLATPAAAQNFPKLTGRVVDTAGLMDAGQQAALTQKLQALEQATSRQLVVATVPDLQGYPIEDYGYKLGRAWGIGQKGANNGVILLVSKGDKKVRIEVGYGLEPILTDALSNQIIQDQILPAFRSGDYAGGINAGVDAITAQLQAPPEQQEQRVQQAIQQQKHKRHSSGSFVPLIFWAIILLFVIIPAVRGRRYGRRYGGFPVMIWGPGLGGWGGGSSGGGWGGFSGGGGGFGGFSGGGGSFGGGGASGGW